jgi:hypothetical protein
VTDPLQLSAAGELTHIKLWHRRAAPGFLDRPVEFFAADPDGPQLTNCPSGASSGTKREHEG